MPLVPQVGYYSGVRGGFGRSRWYPANLLLEVVGTGVGLTNAATVLARFRNAIAVDATDDLVARFIDHVLPPPAGRATPRLLTLSNEHVKGYCSPLTSRQMQIPAARLCADLDAIIELKNRLTRRQWTVLVEGILRLGMTTHVLWVCYANSKCWDLALRAAAGQSVPTESEIHGLLWRPATDSAVLLELGRDAVRLLEQWLEQYVYGRFGLNLILHRLDDVGSGWPIDQVIGHVPGHPLSAAQQVHSFLTHISTNRAAIDGTNAEQWLRTQCRQICDGRLELVTSERGFTRNMFFFLRHTLGQIETLNPEQKEYDQSFLVAKHGRRRGTKWLVEPGPAMLIALVHACCKAQRGLPASLDDFRAHLASYGLQCPAGELLGGRVGTALERLGLVVDSPDAAGGRLLVAPF